MDQNKNPHISTLLHMRLLVGFLGERARFNWWPTAFFESSSRLFLEPVFSKSSRLAQYHGMLEAARRVHDEHLSVGCFHLFRLPEEVEQDLHALLQARGCEADPGKLPENEDAALEALKCLAPLAIKCGEGPTTVGNIKNLDSPDMLRAIAEVYLAGFSMGAKTYPYMVG